MIEDVEKLSAEPEPKSLRQLKLPLHAGVRLPRSKTSQHITSEITLSTGRRSRKSRTIKNPTTRKLRAMNLERNTLN